jgi:hypothetical protein
LTATMTFSITTVSIMTLSTYKSHSALVTLCIKTLSITTLLLFSVQCHILFIVTLNVVMLSVVALDGPYPE